MNREEVKSILELCRPDHEEDLNDPLIAEAFEQLEQDSELCAWFEEQMTIDAEINAALNSIFPPSSLKESILQGMHERLEQSGKNPEASTQADDSAVNSPPSASNLSWFRPWMGIAALFLFASVLLIISPRESTPDLASDEPSVNSIENAAEVPEIIQFLGQEIAGFTHSKFDKRSKDLGNLQSHLARSGAPNPTEIPDPLTAVATIGCVSFDYQGTEMSMICFKNGKLYHLITIDKNGLDKDLSVNTISSEAKLFEHQKQAFKVWSTDDQIYILSTEKTEESMPEFI